VTGISEILVLVFLILVILILPRLFKPAPEKPLNRPSKAARLRPGMRAGIILTLVWPVVTALYWQPWQQNPVPFLSFGILPVFLSWSLVWIFAGRKK